MEVLSKRMVKKRLSKAPEVADFIDSSVQRVYELCRCDPTFPKIVIGQRQYRFDLEAVERWARDGGSAANKGRNDEN